MRFNINLASQPYQDTQRFYLTWIPLLVLLAISAVTSSYFAYHHYRDSRSTQRQLAEKQKEMAQLDKELTEAQATLNLQQNAGTRDQSQFLNELFARKAFSWTRVLADLETVMPNGAQVVSIKPEVTDGEFHFLLTVAVDHREDAIKLARNMESSPRFINPAIINEHAARESGDRGGKAAADNRMKVDIVYVPRLPKVVS
jgi:type IV pilus assembly protein PilN